jgi:hypothetical protein
MLYCKHCDIKYFDEDTGKCRRCGKGLVNGETVYPNKFGRGSNLSGNSITRLVAIVVVVSVITGMSAFFLRSPTGEVVKCREVDEQYSEKIPYEADGIYAYYPKYSSSGAYLAEQWNNQIGAYYNYTVVVQNTDSDDYFYTVQFLVDTSQHGKLNSLSKKLIKRGTNETFDAYFDTDLREEVDGKFVVYPEPVEKVGKIVRFENRTLTRKVTKC